MFGQAGSERGWRRWVLLCMLPLALVGACDEGDDAGGDGAKAAPAEFVEFAAVDQAPDGAALDDAAEIVQRRLKALGVEDAEVVVEGDRIVARGSGVARWSAVVSRTGRLQFRPVDSLSLPDAGATPGPDVSVPPGGTVLPPRGGSGATRFAVGAPVGSGDLVRHARAEFMGGVVGWTVTVRLTGEGTDALDGLARERADEPPPRNSVAIVVDGRVVTVPAFMEPRFWGDVQAGADLGKREARELAAVLDDGPLPVRLRPDSGGRSDAAS